MQDERQVRSGFDGVPLSSLRPQEPPASRDPRVRYLFSGGDWPNSHTPEFPAGGLWVESFCVSNRICQRCDITPVTLHMAFAQIETIPDGMGIPGTEKEAGPGPIRINLQGYYHYPAPVVENLIKMYGERGLVELDALIGYAPATVQSFKLREWFFPDWPKLTSNNNELIAEIERKLELYAVLDSIQDDARRLILAVGEKMLRAIQQYHAFVQGTIDETHQRFSLGGDDRDRKRRYDPLDHLSLVRTGTARRDNELNLMARQSNDLATSLKEAMQSVVGQAATKETEKHAESLDARIAALVKAQEDMLAVLKLRADADSGIIGQVNEATETAEAKAGRKRNEHGRYEPKGTDGQQ